MTSTTFFIIFIPILALILLGVNLLLAPHNAYQEKDSVFECGFHSFLGQNRTQFSISFFVFALLFLLFDLEILLVYPYSVSGHNNDIYGLVIMILFFVLLTLGFIFELGKNALSIDSKQILISLFKAYKYYLGFEWARIPIPHIFATFGLQSTPRGSSDDTPRETMANIYDDAWGKYVEFRKLHPMMSQQNKAEFNRFLAQHNIKNDEIDLLHDACDVMYDRKQFNLGQIFNPWKGNNTIDTSQAGFTNNVKVYPKFIEDKGGDVKGGNSLDLKKGGSNLRVISEEEIGSTTQQESLPSNLNMINSSFDDMNISNSLASLLKPLHKLGKIFLDCNNMFSYIEFKSIVHNYLLTILEFMPNITYSLIDSSLFPIITMIIKFSSMILICVVGVNLGLKYNLWLINCLIKDYINRKFKH